MSIRLFHGPRAATLEKWLRLLGVAVLLLLVVVGFRTTRTHDAMLKRQWGLSQLYAFEAWKTLQTARGRGSDEVFSLVPTPFRPAPEVAPDPGFFDHSVVVRVEASRPGEEIRYTLDGGVPTLRSEVYRGPLAVTETTVLRCRSFAPDGSASATATATYLVDEAVTLPVVSVVCDPVKLFDWHCGIYTHPFERGRAWQREAHVQYLLPTGDNAVASRYLSVPVDLRVHGGWTRRKSKKSLRFRYELNALAGPLAGLWRNAAPGSERRVMVLRNGGNRPRTGLRDKLFQSWYGTVGRLVSRPSTCLLWINGAFWGLYDLRDRVGEELFQRQVGPGDYDVIRGISQNPEVLAGSPERWREMLTFVESSDLRGTDEFARMGELLDLPEWTDYVLFNVYAGHQDWPGVNVTFFRAQGRDGRWHVYPWDHDTTFGAQHPHAAAYGDGVHHDTLGWAVRTERVADRDPVETILLRRLLANEKYREKFVGRFCDLLNSHFRPRRIEEHLEHWIDEVRSVLSRDWERWQGGPENFWGDVDTIRKFVEERPRWIVKHFRERLGLGQLRSIQVDSSGPGRVRVGGLTDVSTPWQGEYFDGLRLEVEAVAEPGARFVRWEPEHYGTNPVLKMTVAPEVQLRAVFLPASGQRPGR
jgi:hypothetical protein